MIKKSFLAIPAIYASNKLVENTAISEGFHNARSITGTGEDPYIESVAMSKYRLSDKDKNDRLIKTLAGGIIGAGSLTAEEMANNYLQGDEINPINIAIGGAAGSIIGNIVSAPRIYRITKKDAEYNYIKALSERKKSAKLKIVMYNASWRDYF